MHAPSGWLIVCHVKLVTKAASRLSLFTVTRCAFQSGASNGYWNKEGAWVRLNAQRKGGVFIVIVQIATWIARIAGVGTMILGWLSWVFHFDVIVVHIALGFVLALSLAILGVALATVHMRRLGGICLLY